jgi:hypothetical protein
MGTAWLDLGAPPVALTAKASKKRRFSDLVLGAEPAPAYGK